MDELRDQLISKLKTLNETIWDGKVKTPYIDAWLDNFEQDKIGNTSERIHALYLLGQFMFFGDPQIRELLKAMFRDLYKYPLIERIRRSNSDTLDVLHINARFAEELKQTRFLGVGNPAESGTHLLYFFRQENGLSKKLFIHGHQIFTRKRIVHSSKTKLAWLKRLVAAIKGRTLALKYPDVKTYVFIDDLCGSGTQAEEYSTEILEDLKRLKPDVYVTYLSLFATSEGLNYIRNRTLFDWADCIFELDDSFRCFDPLSRYFQPAVAHIKPDFAKQMCMKYGQRLFSIHPLGYGNSQLLLGLHHNTPDNTLPIFWSDGTTRFHWSPIFKRYPKIYA